jgi:hypothetical protein
MSRNAMSIPTLRVKAGDLRAAITAPELDHQIAQAEASLAQAKEGERPSCPPREARLEGAKHPP